MIGPCKSNRLWRLLVSIIFKCTGYPSLQIFWESGYLHSFAVITPPCAPGKTALSTSLQTEHPLHGTHQVTRHLGGSGQAPSLPSINAFPGRAPCCSGVLCCGSHPTFSHRTITFAHCCLCQAFTQSVQSCLCCQSWVRHPREQRERSCSVASALQVSGRQGLPEPAVLRQRRREQAGSPARALQGMPTAPRR